MADIVINHASSQGDWFQNYLQDKNQVKIILYQLIKLLTLSKVSKTRDHDLIQKFKLDNIE